MTTPTTTEKTYPAHYTAADAELIAYALKWLEQRKYTQAALARLARTSPTTLNQILKGNYPTSPSKILSTAMAALRHLDEVTNHAIPAVETGVFKMAQNTCAQARLYRNFAVLSAYVGTGKTFAMKHYTASHANTYLIEATPMMTVNSLVKMLARMVTGYEVKGSLEDKFQAIISSLRNTDSLIIIDEAETLTPKQLHTLRRLRDIANIGIVLSGTEYLRGIIEPEHGQFDQIRSRVGFFPKTIESISRDDAAALTQASFGAEDVSDAVIDHLYAYCKGSARMLVEGLIAGIREFRNGRALDIMLVDSVAITALCLQPI
jgi:DNA transposition AAA+ family ATPase